MATEELPGEFTSTARAPFRKARQASMSLFAGREMVDARKARISLVNR